MQINDLRGPKRRRPFRLGFVSFRWGFVRLRFVSLAPSMPSCPAMTERVVVEGARRAAAGLPFGRADDRAALAAPVDGRLFFAGEACPRADFSTAHGAYLTGLAAAERAIEALRR
jgi:hypothetical protein